MPVSPSAYKIPARPVVRQPLLGGSMVVPGLAHAAGAAPAGAPAATLTQQAQGEIDPILASITAAVNARAKSAGQAISGYTNAAASDLGKVDFGAPYRGAESQQAAVDASLGTALAGGGLAGAQDLQARLAQIGEPGVVGAAGNAVAATGTGNSNTLLASGSSNLGALIANAAGAESYGQKLPGLTRLAGLQDIAGANQSAQTQVADKTAGVMTQLPSIVNALRSAQIARTANAATNAYRDKTFTSSQRAQRAGILIGTGIDPNTGTLLPAPAAELGKMYGIDPASLTGTSASVAGKMITAANKSPKIFGSGSSGYYEINPATGQPTQVVAPVVKPAKTGGGTAATGGLSASSWRTLVGQATSSVTKGLSTKPPGQHYDSVSKTFITVPGTGTSATPYHQKLAEVLAMGPATSTWQKKALQVVNAGYAPGENGRPYSAAQAPTIALQGAKEAFKQGIPAAQATATAKATGLLPDSVIEKAIQQVYYGGAYSPVAGSPNTPQFKAAG